MTPKRWTEAEKDHMRSFYHAIGAQNLKRILPDRTPRAIINQAHDMSLRKCQDRLAEMGRENVNKRYQALRRPPDIQA